MWVFVPVKCHSPPISKSSLFLKTFYPPSLLANWSSHFFLINRNHTVKLSSINTIYEKQQHNFNFFIFKFTLKYMLGNVYINTVHARNVYIISSYCREVFPSFQIFRCIQRNPSHLISNQLGKKDFSMEQLPIDSYICYYVHKSYLKLKFKIICLTFLLIALFTK